MSAARLDILGLFIHPRFDQGRIFGAHPLAHVDAGHFAYEDRMNLADGSAHDRAP